MNSTGFSPWKTTLTIPLIGALALLVLACEVPTEGGEMTALELTIRGGDYTAKISGTWAEVTLPFSAPETVTVKSVTLLPNATGLKSGDKLTVDDNQSTVIITTEDGTRVKYTIYFNVNLLKFLFGWRQGSIHHQGNDSLVVYRIVL